MGRGAGGGLAVGTRCGDQPARRLRRPHAVRLASGRPRRRGRAGARRTGDLRGVGGRAVRATGCPTSRRGPPCRAVWPPCCAGGRSTTPACSAENLRYRSDPLGDTGRMRARSDPAFPARWAALVAAGGGFVGVAAFPRIGMWPAAFVSVAMLSVAVQGRRARTGAWLGYLYGAAFLLPLLHWTGIYVGPVPWLILSLAFAGILRAAGCGAARPRSASGRPVLGRRRLGAARGAARSLAVRRFPVGPPGVQPGRVTRALVRGAGRSAAGHLRRSGGRGRAGRRRPCAAAGPGPGRAGRRRGADRRPRARSLPRLAPGSGARPGRTDRDDCGDPGRPARSRPRVRGPGRAGARQPRPADPQAGGRGPGRNGPSSRPRALAGERLRRRPVRRRDGVQQDRRRREGDRRTGTGRRDPAGPRRRSPPQRRHPVVADVRPRCALHQAPPGALRRIHPAAQHRRAG